MTSPLVILDADGVFLNERPYWDAALLTALSLNRLDSPTGQDWVRLSDVAFDELGLQRVTKRRGCNSNWDLAAVLATALREVETKDRVGELLARRQCKTAIRYLISSSDRLVKNQTDGRSVTKPGMDDPLAAFGVDRYGDEFAVVRQTFQKLLRRNAGCVDRTATCLRGSPDAIRAILTEMRDDGFALAVCTGRVEEELMAPMDAFELTTFFAPDRLVTADDVSRAEQALATRPLGKPHWFPAVRAAVGSACANEAVIDGRVASVPGAPRVYVGDGVADFQCVDGARSVGLPLEYVHVRSGVTDTEQERLIAKAPFTLAVVDELADVPALLRCMLREIPS